SRRAIATAETGGEAPGALSRSSAQRPARTRRVRGVGRGLRPDRRLRHRLSPLGLRRRRLPLRRRVGRARGSATSVVSWAAHDLEPYAIQRHVRLRIAFVPLLLGSYSPDMMSKWFVYGIHVGHVKLKAHNAAQFHRGWPGLGFTHSLIYGVAVCLIFWK